MKYAERSIITLEFDKIRERLAACAQTQGARAMCLELQPSGITESVRRRLERTTDARYLLSVKGTPAFGGTEDPDELCERAEKGAVLAPLEILKLASLFRATRSVQQYYKTDRQKETVLDEVFERLLPNRYLEEKIFRSIISEDMIADEASTELAEIRRKIRSANNRIRESLQHFITSPKYAKFLQENIVTMRDGRYVIPVRNEYRNEIKGLVHDTSSSGATVFIEPMSVVEANNELKMLEAKEDHEIERILSELTSECAASATSLKLNYRNLTELAFYFACAQYSVELKAIEPVVPDRDREMRLKDVRHPLLDPATVVPISLELGGENRLMVVTGPNTGGKTVTLKTIGLMAMMSQCGLHVPACAGTRLPVFDEILVDIGDEQSIEQSLSTFSAHMTNIARILTVMSDKSLVLMDELGAGTDPVEGAALAVSILEEVRETGAMCASSTHYAELKTYALNTEGVLNASCEFDIESLRPTYRLLLGTPGKSNAFEISRRLGLPAHIIDRAGGLVGQDSRRFENAIEQLERERLTFEHSRSEQEHEAEEFERYRAEKTAEIERLLADAEKTNQSAHEKARQMVESARASSEFVFAELDKVRKQKESERLTDALEDARNAVRNELKSGSVRFDPVEEVSDEHYVLPRELKKGDEVQIISIGAHGIVQEDGGKDGMIEVRAGLIKTRVKLSDLRLIENGVTITGKNQKKATVGSYRTEISRDFKPEIDVRGLNGEEAWAEIDKYIDDAKIAGMESVRLIHGKGTGALRAALWRFLKADPRIESYRQGQYGEGDIGVTVAYLKQ